MQQEEAMGAASWGELSELIDELEQMVERLSERLLRTQGKALEPPPSEQVRRAG